MTIIYLEKENSFYLLGLKNTDIITIYGKIGGPGLVSVQSHSSVGDAELNFSIKAEDLKAKGYRKSDKKIDLSQMETHDLDDIYLRNGRYFENPDAGKYWEIRKHDSKIQLHEGDIGTAGKKYFYETDSDDLNFEIELLIGDKTRQGYTEKQEKAPLNTGVVLKKNEENVKKTANGETQNAEPPVQKTASEAIRMNKTPQVRRFENKKLNQYWEIYLTANTHTFLIHTGAAGTIGKYLSNKVASREAAQELYDRLIAAKLKEGFTERTFFCPDLGDMLSPCEFNPGLPDYAIAAFQREGVMALEDMFVPLKLTAVMDRCQVNTYFACPTLPEFYLEHFIEFVGDILDDKFYIWLDFDVISADNSAIPLRLAITEGDADANTGMWGAFWDRETGELAALVASDEKRDSRTIVQAVSQKHINRYKPHGRLIPDIAAAADEMGSFTFIIESEVIAAHDLEFEKILIMAIRISAPYNRPKDAKYDKYKEYFSLDPSKITFRKKSTKGTPGADFIDPNDYKRYSDYKSFTETEKDHFDRIVEGSERRINKQKFNVESRYFEHESLGLSFEIFVRNLEDKCYFAMSLEGKIGSRKKVHSHAYGGISAEAKSKAIDYMNKAIAKRLEQGFVEIKE
ncbi:MAG: WGR domain-containing protein [Spirochaetales bacterium]|nr:WGR domain-containing protein [Spirochaetales bacterium]